MTDILIVEDDPNMAFLLKENLKLAAYNPLIYNDGFSGLEAFRKYAPDLCIFDVMLPGMSGFALAKAIRNENRDIPIIFLTAKGMLKDKIEGFNAGGDDYLSKPFSMQELMLRIEAVLKRIRKPEVNENPEEGTVHGSLCFYYTLRKVDIGGKEKKLSAKASELLNLFLEHKNQLVPRQLLLKRVWGDDNFFTTQSMYVYLNKIRDLIKDCPDMELQNIHGVGYKMVVLS